MSHFSVLVIDDQPLTQDRLSEILQPWHEYECTGVLDQYVIDVDQTDEVIAQFNRPQHVVVLASGEVVDVYDNQFWQKVKTGNGILDEKTIKVIPEDAREVENMPAEEARRHGIGYATLTECAEEYYGAFEKDGRFYKKTNPNAHWDWWQVGGRYTGKFIPVYDPTKDSKNQERCWLCGGTGTRTDMPVENGCNGCGGTGIRTKWPTQWAKGGDMMQVKDIPFESLRTEAEFEALKVWDKAQEIIAGRPILQWNALVEKHNKDYDKARVEFNDDQVNKDLIAAEVTDPWSLADDLKLFAMSRVDRARRARRGAVSSFAVVKDGNWYERGQMGWWGVVHDEKDYDTWLTQLESLLDGLSPETWIAVVDCHI